jgi:hypothetical protein
MKPTMKRRTLRWLVPLTIFVGVIVSCAGYGLWPGGAIPSQIRQVLDEAEEWEVYSLFPTPNEKRLPERFQGWAVLGKTTVRDAETRKHLGEALAWGTQRYHQWFPGPACFNPRHGIHASHGGKTVDLVICFECSYVYQSDRMVFRTTGAPQAVFDAVLTKAGVPLRPPWKSPGTPAGSEKESGQKSD